MPTPPGEPEPPLNHETERLEGKAPGWTPRVALWIATWFGTGYFPRMPGTAGSVAALPLVWLASTFTLPMQLALAAALTGLGIASAQIAGKHWGQADDPRIVIDEVAGMLWAGIALPGTWALLPVLILFRVTDITKPWPARWFDRNMHDGIGVMLDDVFAGLWALAGVQLLGLVVSRLA
ncbi:MAG: phosphatidylglycerophosphatase A family protein [Planctomycetota bacterium]|jgi:phosphatidylglycerophosphatase A